MSEVIRVVFICDAKYVLPTQTAIQSIICNDRKNPYEIFVLGVDVENDVFSRLSTKNIKISFISLQDKYQSLNAKHLYVSKAALFKFDLAEIFKDFDKILYLDSDMVVNRSLKELYQTDLSDKYAAVVKDMAGEKAGHHTKMNHQSYFNSGMMLLNLKNLRQDGIPAKLLEYKKHEVWKSFMDQDAFNFVFGEKVLYVSPDYNLMYGNLTFSLEEIAVYFECSMSEMVRLLKKPCILHLTNRIKPWDDIRVSTFKNWNVYYEKLRHNKKLGYRLPRKDLTLFQKTCLFFSSEKALDKRYVFNILGFKIKVKHRPIP